MNYVCVKLKRSATDADTATAKKKDKSEETEKSTQRVKTVLSSWAKQIPKKRKKKS